MATNKKIPMRKCVGCQEMKSKKELIRIIHTPEDELVVDSTGRKNGIILDATGKKNGRGAYICPNMDCFLAAKKTKGLERSLKMAIPEEIYEELQKEMQNIETR